MHGFLFLCFAAEHLAVLMCGSVKGLSTQVTHAELWRLGGTRASLSRYRCLGSAAVQMDIQEQECPPSCRCARVVSRCASCAGLVCWSFWPWS